MVAMTAVPMCLVSGTMTLGIGIMLIALFPTSVFFRPRDLRKCFLNRDANGWRYQPGKIVLGQKGCQRFLPGILSENQSRSTRTIKPYVNRRIYGLSRSAERRVGKECVGRGNPGW